MTSWRYLAVANLWTPGTLNVSKTFQHTISRPVISWFQQGTLFCLVFLEMFLSTQNLFSPVSLWFASVTTNYAIWVWWQPLPVTNWSLGCTSYKMYRNMWLVTIHLGQLYGPGGSVITGYRRIPKQKGNHIKTTTTTTSSQNEVASTWYVFLCGTHCDMLYIIDHLKTISIFGQKHIITDYQKKWQTQTF